MGKNNRARRAAKVRDRQRRSAGRTEQTHRRRSDDAEKPWTSDVELIDGLIDLAPVRLAAGDRQFAQQAAQRLLEFSRRTVERAIEGELLRVVARLFANGWQPSEVVRQARRDGGASIAAVVAAAVCAHHVHAPSEPIDSRWQRQLDAVASIAVSGADHAVGGWFAIWSESAALEPETELMNIFSVLATLRSLPAIEQLVPPPGSSAAAAARTTNELSEADHRLLERVRNLLDKAESTEFEAEAEALTAKAHELITRHAIDTALLAESTGPTDDDQPMSVRIDIDEPYTDAKSLLLQVVAEANRCRTVFHRGLGFSSVLGFPADVAATELLFTSLLVQAQAALAAAGRSAPPGARTRSRSYRSAFLVAYADRIGQRLVEINDQLAADADGTVAGAALPVLRSREAVIDDLLTSRYPGVQASAVRGGHDTAGWVGGRLAADQAQLNFADLPDDDRGRPGLHDPLALGSA